MNNNCQQQQQHIIIKIKIIHLSIVYVLLWNFLSIYLFKHVSIYSSDLNRWFSFIYVNYMAVVSNHPSIFLLNLHSFFFSFSFCVLFVCQKKNKKQSYFYDDYYIQNNESFEEKERTRKSTKNNMTLWNSKVYLRKIFKLYKWMFSLCRYSYFSIT